MEQPARQGVVTVDHLVAVAEAGDVILTRRWTDGSTHVVCLDRVER